MARTQMRNQGQMIDGFVTLAKLDPDLLVGGQTLNFDSTAAAILRGGSSTPSFADQFVTKQYADSLATGLRDKASCRVMLDADTALTGLVTPIFDGVTLINGDRVLLTGQTNQTQNGIYDYSGGVLTRSADADNLPGQEVSGGMYTFISEGTVYASTGWALVSPTGVATLGTDNLIFSQRTGVGTYTAADGLILTGTAFSVDMASLVDTTQGLSISTNNASVNLDIASGLAFNAGAVSISLTAAGGLANTGSALSVNAADFVDSTQGLAINLGNIGVDLVAAGGLALNAGALEVAVADFVNATTGGLTVTGNTIAVNAGEGLILAGNLLNVDAADASLTVAPAGVSVNLDTNSALVLNAGGLNVTVDGSSLENNLGTLRVVANGINESHIDFGSGANQVDAQSLSIVTVGTYVAAGNVDSALGALDTQVAANALASGTNAGNITTNAGNITTNAGNITTNTGNISTNTGNISTNTLAITALQSGAGTNDVIGEVLTVNLGVPNDSTTLANTPVGGVAIYSDGDRLSPGVGNDYTIVGAAITFDAGWDLDASDVVVADYKF